MNRRTALITLAFLATLAGCGLEEEDRVAGSFSLDGESKKMDLELRSSSVKGRYLVTTLGEGYAHGVGLEIVNHAPKEGQTGSFDLTAHSKVRIKVFLKQGDSHQDALVESGSITIDHVPVGKGGLWSGHVDDAEVTVGDALIVFERLKFRAELTSDEVKLASE